jgi:hypothetical protein
MTDVIPHPTARLRAMNDFKSALANLDLLASDYNRRNLKAACEQLIASGAVSEVDAEPWSVPLEDKLPIQEAFNLRIGEMDTLFDVARKVASNSW